MAYNDPDLPNDETTLAEQYLDACADQIEGWEPHDGQVEPVLAEATAVIAAPIVTLLKDELRQDYAGWGETVLGIPRLAAVTATSTAAVEFSGAGTMLAGTQLVATLPTGDAALLITLQNAVGAGAGDIVTGVPVAADQPGGDYNGATGLVEVQDAYEFVATVTLEAPTAGGADEEDRDTYIDKVARRARRFLGVPTTVEDVAAAATDVPGVARAIAINLLDPAHPDQQGTAAAEGHVTIVPLDATGAYVGSTLAAAIVAALSGDGDRIIQAVFHAMAPTLTDLAVAFTATVTAGSDGPAVIAAAEQAVQDYLDPATYGVDDDEPGGWDPIDTVYIYEVNQAIQQVEGIDLVTTLTLNGSTGNVALAGLAPLPHLTAAVGTLA